MCNGDALDYCNSYSDLKGKLCGGKTCTESTGARTACEKHFEHVGKIEISEGRRPNRSCNGNTKCFTKIKTKTS